MKATYPETILFKIDSETMNRLANAASELGHTKSHFIRDAIARRILAYEEHERETILKLRQPARPAQAPLAP